MTAPVHDEQAEPRRAFRVPWHWWDTLAVFALSFVLSGFAISWLAMVVPAGQRSAASIAVSIPVGLGVTLGWLAVRYGRAATTVLGPVRPRALDVLVGVVHGLGAYLLLNLAVASLLNLVAQRSGFELPEVQEGLQMAIQDSPLAPLVIVNAVLLAPLSEELLYRGMLFQAVRARSRLWVAVVVSALVFGLAHLEPLAVGITAGFGLYLAWIFHRRGSLIVSIAAHATFNAISVVLLLGGWV